MEELKPLKPCPFCGGEGVVKIEEFGTELKFLPHCGELGHGCWAMQENWYDTLMLAYNGEIHSASEWADIIMACILSKNLMDVCGSM